jgi:hypothetical protein
MTVAAPLIGPSNRAMVQLFRLVRENERPRDPRPTVVQTLTRPRLQAKLTISQPDDEYEREADRVADEVMRMPEEATATILRSATPTAVQRKCAACEDEEEKKVHRSPTGESPGQTPPIVGQILSQPGRPLPESTRGFFEPRMGTDFSNVRIHDGSQASASAESVRAKAYTVGNSIVFNTGQFSPESASGKNLLAHELTHVVQHTGRGRKKIDRRDTLVDMHTMQTFPLIQRDALDNRSVTNANASFYEPNAPTFTSNDSESLADQERAVQLQDLQTQIDTRTELLNTAKSQLRLLPPASSDQRTALESTLDQTRLGLLTLLETRCSLLTTEIQRLQERIGPNPQSSPDRPGLDLLGIELNQRAQELQNHRRQMAPLRVWQTQREVEAIQQQIEDVNQEIMSLPPLDPEHPTSDMNDPRVQELMSLRDDLERQKQALTESAGEQWTEIDLNTRMAYVMDLLVTKYGYPANGAAGLVGNLNAESGVLPQRLEGSRASTPMTTSSFQGPAREFTPQEVMNRSSQQQRGPRLPGVGLAQWTTGSRRRGLFQHQYGGRMMGTDILFNMDAQVDYLVTELQSNYPGVNRVLTNSGVSVNDACDEVVYNFEVPGSLLDTSGNKRPRTDPQVVQVFNQRRPSARRALTSFNNMR